MIKFSYIKFIYFYCLFIIPLLSCNLKITFFKKKRKNNAGCIGMINYYFISCFELTEVLTLRLKYILI